MKYLSLFASVISLTCCSGLKKDQVQQRFDIRGEAQGTYYTVSYYDSTESIKKSEIDSLLDLFDLSASNYNDSSIISKVNMNVPVELDFIFTDNFLLAQKVSTETNGEYDITVRPLVELWGFGRKKAGEVTKSQVDSILQFVGFLKVKLENGRIVKTDPRVQLDFNSIAQGYSVDYVAKYFRAKGIASFLIDIGGEVYAQGLKSDSTNWTVGIEKPVDGAGYGDSLTAILNLNNMGMATSGNYRKFYEKDGEKYSHTLSPKTGYPVRSNLLSVSVIAHSAAEADVYATAFMVLGLDKTIEFLQKRPDLKAFLIYSDNVGNFKNFETENIKELIKKE